jgi:hypothetical protein
MEAGVASRYPKVAAKIGTVPKLIWLRSRKPVTVGARVQFRTDTSGEWQTGIVTQVNALHLTLI